MKFKGKFKGLFTALITPFKNGEIDFNSLEQLILRQKANHVQGIILCGSTGESINLSHEEILKITDFSLRFSESNFKVISTITESSTKRAIDLTSKLSKFNIDGLLVTLPYYNKPNQNGIYNHIKSISESSNTDIIIYTVPSRNNIDINNDNLVKLSKISNIVGIKDASSDILRPLKIKDKIKDEFSYLSGDDYSSIHYILSGGNGLISVASNIFPNIISKIINLSIQGKYLDSIKLHKEYSYIYNILALESNPIIVKYLMYKLGFCTNEIREPLCIPCKESIKIIDSNIEKIKNIQKDDN